MEKKKSKKANLENYRLIFFEIGMILVLALILTAFEWKTIDFEPDSYSGNEMIFDSEETIISTVREEQIKPKKRPKVIEIINIHKDDDPILSDDVFPDLEPGNSNYDYKNWGFPEVPDEDFGDETVEFIDVHDKPLFLGEIPDISFRKFAYEKVTYPDEAIDNGLEGVVVLQFIVDKNGAITNIETIGSAHPVLRKEAIRILKMSSGKWTPGKQRNRPVNVIYRFPLIFRLAD